MFSNALDANRLTNLTSISFGNFNTSNVTDMSCMFCCDSLTSLDLSSFDMSRVTNTDSMFLGCSGLTEIKTPKAIGSAAVDLPTIDKRLWVDNSNVLNISYIRNNREMIYYDDACLYVYMNCLCN